MIKLKIIITAKIDNRQQNHKRGLYGDREETINYSTECS